MLHNLRIGLKKRRNGKSDVPAKQRGSWPKMCSNKGEKLKQHSSHLRKICACLRHQPLNQKKENFFVDSGASMHMISKKDLSDAELETLTK